MALTVEQMFYGRDGGIMGQNFANYAQQF